MDSGLEEIADLPDSFRQSAAPAVLAERVTLPIDADVIAWLRAVSPDTWQEQINGLLRFFMDTSVARVEAFDHEAAEPEEIWVDPPHLELEFG